MLRRIAFAVLLAALGAPPAAAQPVEVTRKEDVIYGRKYGLAMTMDVFAPKDSAKANSLGIVFCVSGGWFSAKESINLNFYRPFLNRGYTVFAVVHGSQPKFTIPEVLEDMHRAVRYIKVHAKEYNVDPERLGIAGGSAGGHLSLMQGNAWLPANEMSKDPLQQVSSRVAAVACFFPPTDFLNYGKPGNIALGGGTLKGFRPPFDFWERDKETNKLVVIKDEERRKAIGRQISPITHVKRQIIFSWPWVEFGEASAPTMIIHGDKDLLVPIQQAEIIGEKYKEAGVPFELVVKKGGDHGWADIGKDIETLADWFDKHLKKKE